MPDLYGGVAQLGEHLPCKQGVKSSNLSISIRIKMIKSFLCSMYLENHILKRRKDRIFKEENIKTSEGYTERYIKKKKTKDQGCNAIHSRTG